MSGITLKQLRYFDALARELHFGRAAEASSISQPALSLQIKELEALAGAPLVERTARKVQLTHFGEVFLERARKVLSEVEDMSELARKPDGPLKGTLRDMYAPIMPSRYSLPLYR